MKNKMISLADSWAARLTEIQDDIEQQTISIHGAGMIYILEPVIQFRVRSRRVDGSAKATSNFRSAHHAVNKARTCK